MAYRIIRNTNYYLIIDNREVISREVFLYLHTKGQESLPTIAGTYIVVVVVATSILYDVRYTSTRSTY